ncbi:uncharacterized protein LOC127902701 isoform X2 [Citrus sinensis]|uniref:uncharacterized protein LOC127902701 isoform X2 n=1 Tax=Citrus sinensis TaxID=2711 RepID=UPI0022776E5D|nr:uncharacterized protein LOC127902701 isoform X2 [Citrus sinensis]
MMHLPIQQHVNPSRNRNLFSTIPHLKVFGYLIATIAAVLGASVEGIAQPLKETHRVCLLRCYYHCCLSIWQHVHQCLSSDLR